MNTEKNDENKNLENKNSNEIGGNNNITNNEINDNSKVPSNTEDFDNDNKNNEIMNQKGIEKNDINNSSNDNISHSSDGKVKKPIKKIRKNLKFIATCFIILLIIYALWDGISAYRDKKFLKNINYGKKINVDDHNMSVNIIGENNNKTIVILPGMGAVSPILQFKPIAEALSDDYKVVTIEPFGYGFSDIVEDERTNEKITSELFDCIQQLGLEKYYIMAHSMSGIYSLKIANEHPDEILGFIGLDVTVPRNNLNPDLFSNEEMLVSMKPWFDTLGISRLFSYFDPVFNTEVDESYTYSNDELEIFKVLNSNKSYNELILDELRHYKSNVEAMHNIAFPSTIPVLNFVASESTAQDPYWIVDHRKEIKETEKSDVIVLNGGHYIHLYQKETIVKTVKKWAK